MSVKIEHFRYEDANGARYGTDFRRPAIGEVLVSSDRMHRQGADRANAGCIQRMSFDHREERVVQLSVWAG